MTIRIDFPGSAVFDDMAESLRAIAIASNAQAPASWENIARLVKEGTAPNVLPIGSQLTTTFGETTLVWDVVHHSTINSKPAMFLLTHGFANPRSQFDNTEAMYCAENGLAPGTYNFTLAANIDTSYGGGLTYQFTLATAVPANGILMFPWAYNTQASATKIITYSNNASTVALETVDVVVGNGGTALGTADGTDLLVRQRRTAGLLTLLSRFLSAWLPRPEIYRLSEDKFHSSRQPLSNAG